MFYGSLISEGLKSCSNNGPDEVVAVFGFPPDSRIFEGHFPGNPILPGVYQLEAVKFAVERALSCTCRLKSVASIKFFQPILPDQEFTFVMKCRQDEPGRLEVRCQGTTGVDHAKCTEIKASYEINGAT